MRGSVIAAPQGMSAPQPYKAHHIRASWAFYAAVALVGAGSLLLFFREFFFSRTEWIAGDIGDNRFVITILEHWRSVFRGISDFTSPNFFAPLRGVLGYSESFFLFWPPYAVARAMGFDRYLSFELMLIAMKALGFVWMFFMLLRVLRIGRWLALLGAVLFTISNLYYLGHSHLTAVVFAPLVCILAQGLITSRGRLAWFYLMASAVSLALLLFTSLYIGWFVILATVMILIVARPVAACVKVHRAAKT